MTTFILAFDPGEKNIGYAMFRCDREKRTADLRNMTVLTPDSLSGVLRTAFSLGEKGDMEVIFVVENFRVDMKARGRTAQSNAFQWSEMQTIRQIGKIELCADWIDAKVVMQEPAILTMARKWSDIPLPKGNKHIPDDKSAYVHGVHYIMNTLQLVNIPEQVSKYGQEALS